VHGITGSLGWALAPAMLVPIDLRVFLARGAGLRGHAGVCRAGGACGSTATSSLPPCAGRPGTRRAAGEGGSFGFLKIPAVWMCFAFFFFYAIVLSVVQAFAPEAARHLHDVPVALVAMCLTVYMVCSAGGMVLGGFLASDPARCERIVGIGFGLGGAGGAGDRFRRMCRRWWCRCCSA
jgi:FSR family fosmidomycin resistance protein-like MFS transporter